MWFVQSGVYGVSDNKNKGHTRKARSVTQILSVSDITTWGQESHQESEYLDSVYSQMWRLECCTEDKEWTYQDKTKQAFRPKTWNTSENELLTNPVYNTLRQDYTTLESYHGGKYFQTVEIQKRIHPQKTSLTLCFCEWGGLSRSERGLKVNSHASSSMKLYLHSMLTCSQWRVRWAGITFTMFTILVEN